MSWSVNANSAKCDVCGKFIAYADLISGTAKHVLITPDSEYTTEEYESLCSEHNNADWAD